MARALGVCALLAWVAFSVAYEVRYAGAKLFWLDEAFGLQLACKAPLGELVLSGAPSQCSPHPLYYLIEKSFYQFFHSFGPGLFVHLRVVSLLAGGACLLLLGAGLQAALGFVPAAAALLVASQQDVFHQYAAEARPYALWCFLFLAAFFASVRLQLRRWEEASIRAKAAFAFTAVLLAITASPGWMQIWCFSAAVLLSHWPARKIPRREWLYFGAVCLGTAALGSYYARHVCPPQGSFSPEALHGVLSMLFFPGIAGGLFTAIGLVGAAAWPMAHLREGWRPAPVVTAMSRAALIQLLVFAVSAALVIHFRYYFVQRIFLYLVLLRAVFVAAGLAYLTVRLRAFSPGLARGVPALLLLTLLFLVIRFLWATDRARVSVPVAADSKLCGNVELFADPQRLLPHNRLNAVYRLSQARAVCSSGGMEQKFVSVQDQGEEPAAWMARPDWYMIAPERPPETSAMTICGWPVNAP